MLLTAWCDLFTEYHRINAANQNFICSCMYDDEIKMWKISLKTTQQLVYSALNVRPFTNMDFSDVHTTSSLQFRNKLRWFWRTIEKQRQGTECEIKLEWELNRCYVLWSPHLHCIMITLTALSQATDSREKQRGGHTSESARRRVNKSNDAPFVLWILLSNIGYSPEFSASMPKYTGCLKKVRSSEGEPTTILRRNLNTIALDDAWMVNKVSLKST